MKHTFIKLYILLAVGGFSNHAVHAQYVVTNPIADPAALGTWAEGIISTIADVGTQINTYYTYLQQSVLDPLANALIIATQIQQQTNTINLITGSLGGNSLLIQNPEQWIQNKGLNSVRINIGDISQQNGTYSSSILGSVINSYRGTSNLTNVLSSLGNSSIPNIVQNNLCKDASLSNVAKNDVMKSDGTYDLEAYQNRKQDLFNSLCVGNPSVNIQLGQKLTEVGKQRPDIAGTDSLLAVSFGDNEYNRSLQSQLAIAKNKEVKEKAAENDLNRGGGIASATKCTEQASAEGGESNIPCRSELITNVGSALSDSFNKSINGKFDILETFGAGAGNSIGSIISLVSSIFKSTDAFEATPSGPVAPLQDLTDPRQQTERSDTVKAPLQAHLDTLSSLESTERSFLGELSAYENSIQSIQACYEKLIEDYKLENDSRVISALGFTSNKLAVIASTKAESTRNLNSINTTRALINDTLVSVAASKSTMEMTTLFTSYQKAVKQQNLPDISASAKRQGDFVRFSGTIRQENASTGTIPALTNQCAQIRQSYEQNNQSSGGDGGAF